MENLKLSFEDLALIITSLEYRENFERSQCVTAVLNCDTSDAEYRHENIDKIKILNKRLYSYLYEILESEG